MDGRGGADAGKYTINQPFLCLLGLRMPDRLLVLAAAGAGSPVQFSPQALEGGLDALQQQLLTRQHAEELARQQRQHMYLLRTAMMVGGQVRSIQTHHRPLPDR